MGKIWSLIWRWTAVAGMVAASWESVRLAYADYLFSQTTIESVRQAASLVPGNWLYHTMLAALVYEDDSEGSESQLRIALTINPRDSKSWVDLGLRAEFHGRYAEAERFFLEAARVDKQYVPRWTLANYYFRRQQAEPFWHWAREAAAMSFGDPLPLFRLCLLMSPDSTGLMEKLGITKPEMVATYLGLVLSGNKSTALAPGAQQLLQSARPVDTPLLLGTCDRLLANKDVSQALELWNGLCDRKYVPYPAIPPGGKASLTNPDWRFSPISQGFDWRLPQLTGVAFARQEDPIGLRIGFSGRQPESCEILSQIVPVAPARSYEFQSIYRTAGIAAETGLVWKVFDLKSGQALATDKESLSGETETTASVPFRTLPGTQAVRISLTYQRASGTTRIEGSVWLGGTRLEGPN